MLPGDPTTEPIRRNLYVAGAVVSLATLFGGLSTALLTLDQVEDPSGLAILAAVCTVLGTAIGQFAVVVFGAERARDAAWAPKSVDEIIDADAVIARAEADGEA